MSRGIMILLRSRTSVALTVAGIFLLGALAGAWRAAKTRERILDELLDNARRCAIAFDPAELRRLAGAPSDADTPMYRAVKERLQRFQAVDPDVRFVYIFRHLPARNEVVFLADSAAVGDKDESRPGDVYEEAADSPGLQAIIADGRPATEGPLGDAFGTWVTGYALIGEAVPGQPREILGFDLAATDWYLGQGQAATSAACYVWLLFGLPLAALWVRRRERSQLAAIRNLSEAMEQSHTAVMIVDLGHHIEYANAGLCDQLGRPRRELVGRPWREFQAPDTPPETNIDLDTTLRAGRTWHGEWTGLRPDGSTYPVRAVVSPVAHRDGSPACYVAVLEDATTAKRIEAEMRAARERAEAGDRAKGQFLATMSHEVRTPLNGIIGFSELLLEGELPADQREYVRTIRTSADSLLRLTGDILDFSKIESGKLKLEPQRMSVREVIEDTLDLLAGPAGDKHIELLHWIDPGVPAAVVADAGRLRQVLVNLVGNAVKFTPAGEIAVDVSQVPFASRNPISEDGRVRLQFTVRDTGIGIAPDKQHLLFRPFSQVEGGHARRFGGSGLGLVISRMIVQLMDGEISFTSRPGEGSVFTFTIRVPLPPGEAPAPGPLRLAGRSVALCVCSPSLRTELVRVVAGTGAEVTTPDLAALPSAACDLAVVEATGELLAGPIGPNLPPLAGSIALVPLTWPGERRAQLRRHFQATVNKPVRHEHLVEVLAGSVAGRTAPAPAPVAGPAPVPAPSEWSGLRVLLVEDNAVNRRLMQAVLGQLGCQWHAAENGREALQSLTAATYDVVLMDLHMPEIDGLATTRRIRAGEAGDAARGIWIIILTADVQDDVRRAVAAAGANGFLGKPLQRSELVAALGVYAARGRRP
jgi:PAS domain S-box-containing protein